MKGLAQKTIGELILMVVVVIILGAASVAALPYIQDLLAQYFGLTVDNALTQSAECSYLRCTIGCNDKVKSNQWSKLGGIGSSGLGVCPCENVPEEFHENNEKDGKICGSNSEQYPIEFRTSTIIKVTQNSFPSNAKPNCLSANKDIADSAGLFYAYQANCGTSNNVNTLNLAPGKYYVSTAQGCIKALPFIGPCYGNTYTTYISNGPKYHVLSSSNNDIQDNFDIKGTPTSYRVIVDKSLTNRNDMEGVLALRSVGCAASRLGTDCLGSMKVREATAEKPQEHEVSENEEYAFNFGIGTLIIKVLSIVDPPRLEISYFDTTTCMGTNTRICAFLLEADICRNRGCDWVDAVPPYKGVCTIGDTKPCDTFKIRAECVNQGCNWIGLDSKPLTLTIEPSIRNNRATITNMVNENEGGNLINGAVVDIIIYNPNDEVLPFKPYFRDTCKTDSNGKCSISFTVNFASGDYRIYGTVTPPQGPVSYRFITTEVPFKVS
jgi:hypothetical protein